MILPIEKPSIVSYLHHAHYLAIAQTDIRCKYYLLSSFLNLYTRPNKVGTVVNVDFFAFGGYYPVCPFVAREFVGEASLFSLGTGPVEQACAILDSGNYVEVILDEFFMKEKASYKKFSFLHPSLIYGYCRNNKIFYAQGFDADRNYKNLLICFDEFCQAFGNASEMRRLSIVAPALSNAAEGAGEFPAAVVRQYLLDFLESKDSSAPDCSSATDSAVDLNKDTVDHSGHLHGLGLYGMATYEFAIHSVATRNGMHIDIRPWCVFYDHKLRLWELYCHLERSVVEKFDDEKLSVELKRLVNDFRSLRNYLLESQLDNRLVKIPALISNLTRLEETERRVIAGLIVRVESLIA